MIICCDIDGVLADVRGYVEEYLPHDWKTYFSHTHKFLPILPVAELLHCVNKHHPTYLVTGRPESNRDATLSWLSRQYPELDILSPNLLMRPNNDPRSTCEIKMKWFRELKPDLIIDDDPAVVKAATEEGLIVLQVHGFRVTNTDMVPNDYFEERAK